MQKFVTIYLDSLVYQDGKWLPTSTAEKHGAIEEHLSEDLRGGWRIVSVTGLGGANGLNGMGARGWLAVVLEK